MRRRPSKRRPSQRRPNRLRPTRRRARPVRSRATRALLSQVRVRNREPVRYKAEGRCRVPEAIARRRTDTGDASRWRARRAGAAADSGSVAGWRSSPGCWSASGRGTVARRWPAAECRPAPECRPIAECRAVAERGPVAEHRADFRAERPQHFGAGDRRRLRAGAAECARAGADAGADHDAGQRQRDVDQSALGAACRRQYVEPAAGSPGQYPRDANSADTSLAAAARTAAGQHADATASGHNWRPAAATADSDNGAAAADFI